MKAVPVPLLIYPKVAEFRFKDIWTNKHIKTAEISRFAERSCIILVEPEPQCDAAPAAPNLMFNIPR
jgi:hypothetical protein